MTWKFAPFVLLAVILLRGCVLAPPDPVLTLFPPEPAEYQNYNQLYHPIEGNQPRKMADGSAFAFSAVLPQANGELVHRLTETQAAAIKWEAEKRLAKTQGRYVTEVTFSEVWPGVVYNPLWLYSEGSAEGGHEFDFEYMDGRLDYFLHNGDGGFLMRSAYKDLGGHRVRWMIERRRGRVVMSVRSLTDGWSDRLVITRRKVARWAKQKGAPPDLRLPPSNIAMFPATELWRCRSPQWCGDWRPLREGQTIDMTIHGYSFTP